MNVEMCSRLKEERERLGLTQQQLADIGGVTKTTLFNYENGREPSSGFIAAIATAGADVLYILTGQRMAGAVPALSRDEAIVLDHYRHCDDDGKAFMKQAGAVASKPKAKKASGE
jgi:transcriptional regulator with XRE-family HTH domain